MMILACEYCVNCNWYVWTLCVVYWLDLVVVEQGYCCWVTPKSKSSLTWW